MSLSRVGNPAGAERLRPIKFFNGCSPDPGVFHWWQQTTGGRGCCSMWWRPATWPHSCRRHTWERMNVLINWCNFAVCVAQQIENSWYFLLLNMTISPTCWRTISVVSRVLSFQTTAVPNSLEGAKAGPQRWPGPAWWCCCKTRCGLIQFSHTNHTRRLILIILHYYCSVFKISLCMFCVPWFWTSLSSLNWVTCWWSLASFGLWQPCFPTDVGDWQGEGISDDRLGCQQGEDKASVLFPGLVSSVEVLKKGDIIAGDSELLLGEAAAGIET